MRYQFIGYPVPYKGKPLWEIVGNLKNFGIGRLIVADEHKDKFVEPHFYKIVKVQPLETPKEIGVHRGVLVWAEHVMRGKKLTQLEQLEPESRLTKFHLVPKEDEAKYLSGITTTPRVTVIPRYQACPPLFKMIWEMRQKKFTGQNTPIPKIQTVIDEGEKSFEVLSSDDLVEEPLHSDLHKSNVTVEELYKKIYLLRKKLGIEQIGGEKSSKN